MAINNELNKSIRTYLEKKYIRPEFMRRDRELEKYLILKSKLELKLLSNLHAGVRDEWNKDKEEDLRKSSTDEYIRNDKLVIFTQKGKLIYENNSPDLKTYKCFEYALGDILFSTDKNFNIDSFMADKNIGGEYRLVKKVAEHGQILHRHPPAFDNLIIAPIYEQGDRIKSKSEHHDSFYSLISREYPLNMINTPLICSLALARDCKHEEEAVRYLQDWYKVDDKIFSSIGWFDGRNGWDIHRRVNALWDYYQEMKNELIFKFCTETGHPYLLFEKNLENNTLLPIVMKVKDKRFSIF